MKNVIKNKEKKATRTRRVVLLLIITFAGLTCLTGMASAAENYSISYDTNPGEKIDHGTLTPIGLASNSSTTIISTGGSYILDQGTFTNATIRITATSDVILFLNGTNITNTPSSNTIRDTSPLQLMTNSNVTLVLIDGSKNNFTCNGMSGSNYNIQSGIFVDSTAKLTVRGQSDNSGKLTANGGYYSAGIGGGPNGNPGKIIIEGGNVTANSYNNSGSIGYGAGIGGGGGNTDKTNASTEEIIIRGKANVTAASKGNGAGIGGGGNNNNTAGASGTIKIYGDATVTATSDGRGAGIGGGGCNNNTAGAGGTIEIYDNATVTATGLINGAGIGGGGNNNITAGASGNIAISGNPIIVAKSSVGMDIGSGTNRTDVPAAAGLITIDSGNVYAEKTSPIENQYGDLLGMITVSIKTPSEEVIYKAINGNDDEYDYKATTDENGNAFVWLPLGNQLVIYVNTADMIIEISTIKLTDGPNEIEPSDIAGYITPSSQTVTWDNSAPTSLSPVIFTYTERDVLVLKAYNSVTLAEIETSAGAAITYTIDPVAADDYYDYSNDVAFLTASIELEYSGQYTLTPQGSTIVFIRLNDVNTVNVYYTPQSGSSTGGGGGGNGHGSATVVPGDKTNGSNNSGSNETSAQLTILCVDERGNELFTQSLTAVVGSSEMINAPPLEGYKLLTNEKIKNVRMGTGDNLITFKYAESLTDTQQPSDMKNQNNIKWNLLWFIFVPILILGIVVSFFIGRKNRE